jgi:hypothetical protein
VNARIWILVQKAGLPTGHVLLEDAGALVQGLHDALARLIQRQLGFSGRTRLHDDAKRLTTVAITDVSAGSGVLECVVLPVPPITGRSPAAVAAFDLINGIRSFSSAAPWPAYLPGIVRNRIGAAVAPVLTETASVGLTVEEDGVAASCTITEPLRAALQEPERFQAGESVEIVGRIFDINIQSKVFKMEAAPRKVAVHFRDDQFGRADELRWKRVFVKGYPKDEQCKSVENVEELRTAGPDEEDGVSVPTESHRGERTEAYISASGRAASMRGLGAGWDTYGAVAPPERVVNWSLHFLGDAAGVLVDYGIEPPIPFVVPTPAGGIQFEWSREGRELELEVAQPENFRFLAVHGEQEREGTATRWEAMRLIRWLATGEQV